ncbi:hypothetical protein ABZ128_29100 [Streptomyces sp. NPDC006326]|uniref:hypothetical protein n=1 Tax=Streptomyces sp. NPDC006326 TaxID=3156752 RepID=UPI0033A2EC01
MTLVQMESRSAGAGPVHRMAVDAPEAADPQVCDDMTVEVALAVMASARTGHLLVCDEGGRTGLVTQARLAAFRAGDTYTDRVRLRDVLGDREPFPFTSPLTATAETEQEMHHHRVDAEPVVAERGAGVLALAG